MILIKIDALKGFGDAQVQGYNTKEWFVAESFTFGVEREVNQSGQGGTSDVSLGVGELQECTISKALDSASPTLAQFAVNGSSLGTAEIHFLSLSSGTGMHYLAYKLDRCFIKSWSTSGDADDRPTEEVAFYYNKIAFQYAKNAFSWDRVTNKAWTDHGIKPLA